jgi:hypothetical protein
MQDSDRMVASLANYPTGEDISEVYWRTLIANRSRRVLPDPSLKASYEAFREYLDKGHGIDGELDPKSPEIAFLWDTMQPFLNPLLLTYEYMVFGVTTKKMMGLVPPNTRKTLNFREEVDKSVGHVICVMLQSAP